MTTAAIRQAIRGDAALAVHWQRVFPDPGPPPDEGTPGYASWETKKRRVGHLHPDAAHAIGQVLGVDPKVVAAAKRGE